MADRVEIGFSGGQVVATRLTGGALEDLRKALRHPEGWHDLETEDGRLAVDLGRVVFVRVAAAEHRIGFITEG
jgi:hypothetical protein